MKYGAVPAVFVLLVSCVGPVAAQEKNSPPPKISKQTRMELVRLMNAEVVYVRSPFPMGRGGLKLRQGVVSPTGAELQQLMAMWGPAAKSGDAVRITNVIFKDNYVHVEINGGPVKKQKWYERISVGGAGGETPIAPSDPNANARGSFVDVYFDPYVPEMTGQEFKAVLRPVLDFDSKSREEAYLETVPPKAKEAILNHQVLVGMNRDMVTLSKGRPPKKVREHEDEVDFEEWIYGEPPQDVEFVRFVGDEVVRLETMRVDGTKLVKTEKELSLDPVTKVAKQNDEVHTPNAPTLRRPGEEKDGSTVPGANAPARVPIPDPGQTSSPNFASVHAAQLGVLN
ncbi:MAG TPA: hypothetical protein VK466_04805 [Terriglobales bacterium]|nr:hypothetical protein [Terriglobales bacterium]